MESASFGTYELVVFVLEISLVRKELSGREQFSQRPVITGKCCLFGTQ